MNGTRILDLSRVLAGPWAVQHLADQGAVVVKVEPPGGDETRRFGPLVDGQSTYFLCANRNKRSIVLDLKTDAGREVLTRLVQASDVLVENFRPGVLDRLGFPWEHLHALNPKLVLVAISAFGHDTPGWSERPGYDLLLQHMGGQTAMTGEPGSPPLKHPTSIADQVAGLYAVQGILHGLLRRERTGVGQRIVVNMLQAQAAGLAYHASRHAVTGIVGGQRGNSHAGIVPYDVYRVTDGWFVVACANDATWQRLRDALELPDRPEWRANVDRVSDRHAVDAAIQAVLAGLSSEEAEARLVGARVPCGAVLTPDATLAHPAVDTIRVDHPHFGEVELPGPVLQTDTTHRDHTAPPDLGADRDAILDTIRATDEERRAWTDAGAFGDG